MFLSLIPVFSRGLQRLLKYLFVFNLFSGIFTKSQNKVKQTQTSTNRTTAKKQKPHNIYCQQKHDHQIHGPLDHQDVSNALLLAKECALVS